MIQWFKQHYPNIPVVALRFHSTESVPGADDGTVSDDSEAWLVAVEPAVSEFSILLVSSILAPFTEK